MVQQMRKRGAAALIAALVSQPIVPVLAAADASGKNDDKTTTPIKHVIVIIGENRSFDHVYATYKPNKGETVDNLLSKRIIKADGSPGPNYSVSGQYSAVDFGGTPDTFSISPQSRSVYNSPGNLMPPAMTGGAPRATRATAAPFSTFAAAVAAETDLPSGAVKVDGDLIDYEDFLLTGATGLATNSVDTRLPTATTLRQGVFQLTPFVRYDDYASSPVHRFYQMWQQMDCNAEFATTANPSGCLSDLWPYVETSVGAGSNGNPQPAGFNNMTTGEGSTAMAFYNVLEGDAPYMKELADKYTLSDNFHQSVMGGTGANHVMLGYGDAIFYSDGKGNATQPPANQVENPNPQPGTNNYYDQDGYSGGSYSKCADLTEPGVAPVVNYLQSLARPVNANCAPGAYYLLNNYNPGFIGDGTPAPLGANIFTIPPTSVPHIGDSLMAKQVSFKYYGEHWNKFVAKTGGSYCNICNFFQYATDIMTDATLRTAHIQDTDDLYADIQAGTLPAVSFVKPSGIVDGHPASSKLDLFEGFVKKIVTDVKANKDLWKDTAIMVTFDEGGGYYDSGYVQPIDFFGDGTRIPLLVISPFSTGGHVVHTYYDHVSILKFIEANWSVKPVSTRSRDNLPNPKAKANNPYVPTNSPALGDLLEMFDFK